MWKELRKVVNYYSLFVIIAFFILLIFFLHQKTWQCLKSLNLISQFVQTHMKLCRFFWHLVFHPLTALWLYYLLCSRYLDNGHVEPWACDADSMQMSLLSEIPHTPATHTNSMTIFLSLLMAVKPWTFGRFVRPWLPEKFLRNKNY